MYSLRISAKAKKELKALSKKSQLIIIDALEDIQANPLEGKPLTRSLLGKLSYRVGVYRIIYIFNRKDKIVTVLTAGHRSTVYRS